MTCFLLLLACFLVQEEDPPFFTVTTCEGQAPSGRLLRLREDGTVTLGGEQNQPIRGAEVVSLRRSDLVLPPYPTGEQILFANGDRLPGNVVRLFNERLQLNAQLGDEVVLTVPLSSIKLIWLAAPDAGGDSNLWQQLASVRRDRDQIHLRNGDVVEGTLINYEARQFRIEQDGKEQEIDATRVAAVALSSQLTRVSRPRGHQVRAVLTNGARVTLAGANSEGKTLQGQLTGNAPVSIPMQQVVRLDVVNSRVTALSDLKPKAFEHLPFLGVRWSWTADRAVSGRPLRLAGSTYDKGIGLHSASRIHYALDGKYRWFEGLVGLDEDSGRSGNVRVSVLVDGKPQPLGWNGEMNGGDPPQAIRINLRGARELVLVVDYGRRGDVQDHVDWVDPRLIR